MKTASFIKLLGIGVTTAGTPPSTQVPPTLQGSFDGAPAVQWIAPLPGPRPESANHTELGEAVVIGGYVLLGSAGANALFVLDRRSGALVNRLETAAPVQSAPQLVGPSDAPTHVVFSDGAGTTFCYTVAAAVAGGNAKWSHFSGAPVLSTPAVDGDHVYVSNVADQIYALELDTGALVWRHAQRLDPSRAMELELFGAPAPVPMDGAVLTGFSDGTLVALESQRGEVLWQRRVGEGRYPDLLGAAVPRGKEVLLSGYSEPLVALDTTSRNVRWRQDVGGPWAVVPAPGPPETLPTTYFHAGGDGILRSIDAVDGDITWSWDSDTGAALTRPVVTPAGLLVGSAAGTLYLIDPDSGDETWRLRLDHTPTGFTAPPVVSGRQALAVTNAGNVISLVVTGDEPAWIKQRGVTARAAKAGPTADVPVLGGAQ